MKTISLIPYLNDKENSGFFLAPLFEKEGMSPLGDCLSPFFTINTGAAFSKIIRAELKSDARHVLTDLFLIVQKDAYGSMNEETSFSNEDVDTLWQNVLQNAFQKSGDFSSMLLKSQCGKNGKFHEFKSTFLCTRYQCYFHPICPKCGQPLEKCVDDTLLLKQGLGAYSKSLNRYLFCQTCYRRNGGSQFFTFLKREDDPYFLGDCTDLIHQYKNIYKNKSYSHLLPCIDCTENRSCYGDAQLYLKRLKPFSFYPFHMLISSASTLCAEEYLALVSGARFEDIRMHLSEHRNFGRLKCLNAFSEAHPKNQSFFLFDKSHRFYETLYLKLSFLEDNFSLMNADSNLLSTPPLGLSLHNVWMSIQGNMKGLPTLWSVRQQIVNPVSSLGLGYFYAQPALSSMFYNWSLNWFYALLANKVQPLSDVFLSLKDYFLQFNKKGEDIGSRNDHFDPAFLQPRHIFWMSDNQNFNSEQKKIWKEALKIGFQIVKASYFPESYGAGASILKEINELKGLVKAQLFQQPSTVAEAVRDDQDEKIFDILKSISQTRQIKKSSTKKEKEPLPDINIDLKHNIEANLDFLDTVILSKESNLDDYDKKGDEDILQQTVLLSTSNSTMKESDDDILNLSDSELEQTQIQTKGMPENSTNEVLNDRSFEETIVQSLNEIKKDKVLSKVLPDDDDDDDDDTLVLRPRHTFTSKKRKLDHEPNEFTETIILSADKITNPEMSEWEETMIQKSGSKEKKSEGISSPPKKDKKKTDDNLLDNNDVLEQTIILRSDDEQKNR